MSKPTIKALTARIEAIERVLRTYAARNYVTADILHGVVKLNIDGLREVRGNDGVLLETINLREPVPKRKRR